MKLPLSDAKLPKHHRKPLLQNARRDTPPASVQNANHARLGLYKKNRYAVSSCDGQKNANLVRHVAIARFCKL